MRLIRLIALFGSLMLLVFSVSRVLDERASERDEQEDRAIGAMLLTETAIIERVDALRALVGFAIESPDADVLDLTTSTRAIVGDGSACLGITAADCSDGDLLSLGIVSELLSRQDPAQSTVAGIDEATNSVVVVAATERDGAQVTAVVQTPIVAISAIDLVETSERLEADVTDSGTTDDAVQITVETFVPTVDDDGATTGTVLTVADGRRTASMPLAAPFDQGVLLVSASVDGTMGLAGDATGLYATLLLLSTVLLGLAAWTFLAERSSLEKRATTDDLTGLVNRREFERLAIEEIEKSERLSSGACIMVVDLNGFKEINDTHGHQFGDLVLKAVSERLVSAVRDTDRVGRWGGDEFVILLPGLEERSAVRNRAERISDGLAESPVVGDIRMQASIGAAIFPRHGRDLDSLIRTADVAMYEAKTTGVGHRIADTIAAADDELQSPSGGRAAVSTYDYIGPDRRRAPVPPPPGDDPELQPASSRDDTGSTLRPPE
ncbi:MAG: GGDEF domain-containing protein [Actinomycetota bacterium]